MIQVLLERQQAFLLNHVFPFVAIAALALRVFPLERISGFGVIELLLAAFPIDQFEIVSLVLHMAEFALPVILGGMQALSRFDPFPQECMAGQAFVARYLLLKPMAFAAIIEPLQMRVRPGEISWRKLGRYRSGRYDQNRYRNDKCPDRYSQNTHLYPVQTATTICINMIVYMIIANG